ncbi:hypothetical protein EVG20_g9296 [Dentipellis fragilis]|uniref:Uncharacterized protein n=1 Tax=Dentipellis fragilis TaxID=205917 RepID=A0A4Y9XZB2_9AGAM|nr:hypothetical protein EVG20_g9296 [Dentipellis fragilis]
MLHLLSSPGTPVLLYSHSTQHRVPTPPSSLQMQPASVVAVNLTSHASPGPSPSTPSMSSSRDDQAQLSLQELRQQTRRRAAYKMRRIFEPTVRAGGRRRISATDGAFRLRHLFLRSESDDSQDAPSLPQTPQSLWGPGSRSKSVTCGDGCYGRHDVAPPHVRYASFIPLILRLWIWCRSISEPTLCSSRANASTCGIPSALAIEHCSEEMQGCAEKISSLRSLKNTTSRGSCVLSNCSPFLGALVQARPAAIAPVKI